jgi:hypothetical protein
MILQSIVADLQNGNRSFAVRLIRLDRVREVDAAGAACGELR